MRTTLATLVLVAGSLVGVASTVPAAEARTHNCADEHVHGYVITHLVSHDVTYHIAGALASTFPQHRAHGFNCTWLHAGDHIGVHCASPDHSRSFGFRYRRRG